MSAELELAKQKINDLETKIKALMSSGHEQLQLLPNGDLHRGMKNQLQNVNIDVEVIPAEQGNPLNKAMASILTAAKGGHALTCLWCGMQWEGLQAEKEVRQHLKEKHPSIVEGYDKVVPEMLMANLQEAKDRLAEATA